MVNGQNTGKFLALPWTHLSKRTSDLIDSEYDSPVLNFTDRTWGSVFIYVMSEEAMRFAVRHCGVPIPADLQVMLNFARKEGAHYLLIDKDAPEVEDLPTYREVY